jgi:hypothetical protein
MVLIRQLFSTFVTQNISSEQENQCKNIRFKFRFHLTHHSTIPLFHHSNWGEAPNFSCSLFLERNLVALFVLLVIKRFRPATGENQRPPAELGAQDAPWKGPGPPLLVAADFFKF